MALIVDFVRGNIKRRLSPCLTCLFLSRSASSLFCSIVETLCYSFEAVKVYSLEFLTTNTQRISEVSFFVGKELFVMFIGRCGGAVPAEKSIVLLSSQRLSAVLTKTTNVCCRTSRRSIFSGLTDQVLFLLNVAGSAFFKFGKTRSCLCSGRF